MERERKMTQKSPNEESDEQLEQHKRLMFGTAIIVACFMYVILCVVLIVKDIIERHL